MRPRILITGPNDGHRLSWWCITLSLWIAGARVLRATTNRPQEDASVQGILISGGTDVLPERYGAQRKQNYQYDEPRDAVETAWITRAFAEKIPLLGICRGVQLMNVCRGGTLYMDIKLVCETARHPGGMWSKIFIRKPILVKDGSKLARWFRVPALMVNSLHSQSLAKIGDGLQVTAWEENNIVQAVEGTDPTHFLLGVQWHPEFMLLAGRQRRVFRKFVAAAKQRKA